ncbi:MAG: glycosyltransferase [Vicinamibacterales bacterium]
MTSAESIAVVVPTWNGVTELPRLLEALAAQQGRFRPEVIAVDSGSTDGTLDLLHARGVRVLTLAPQRFNHGDARNRGLAVVETPFAVLTVQDAVPVGPRWLESLVLPLMADATLAGTWARQLPHEGASRITRHYHAGWIGASATPRIAGPLTSLELDAVAPAHRHALCAFDNVCACIRMSVWRDHPFPAAVFAEDLEWASDVLRVGGRLAFVPEAVVRHSHDRSVGYELRRTRLAHARLHRLFGLSTVPSLPSLAGAVARSVPLHIGLAAREPRHRARAMARGLGLAVAWPLGQYLGARDSRAGRVPAAVRGV